MSRKIYNRKPYRKEQKIINAIKALEEVFPQKFTIREIAIGGEYSNHIYYGPSCADGPFSEAIIWIEDDLKEEDE